MTTSLVTAPTVEPVTLRMAKIHLRIDNADSDEYISRLIKQAREFTEVITNRSFVQQTWDYYLDCFPYSSLAPIHVPKPPLQSVTSIKYYDIDGVQQTWSSSLYTVNANRDPGQVYPAYAQVYPTTRDIPDAVVVRFVSGYADSGASPADLADNVPESIKQAILVLAGHMHENAEATTMMPLNMTPIGYRALIYPYRNFSF